MKDVQIEAHHVDRQVPLSFDLSEQLQGLVGIVIIIKRCAGAMKRPSRVELRHRGTDLFASLRLNFIFPAFRRHQ